MKVTFLVGMLVACGLVSSCQSVTERRISANADTWQRLPDDTQQRLRHHIVRPGDTEAMVSIALGRPDKVLTQAAPNGQTETVWQYVTFEGLGATTDIEPTQFRGYMTTRTTSVVLAGGVVKQVKTIPPGATASRIAAAPQGPVTPKQALEYAKSVVLIRRVVKGDEIHAYVKEVWRFDPATGPAPAVGSEYGQPMPFMPAVQNPERDGIAFEFGSVRPDGLPRGWRITVADDGSVPMFMMDVPSLRHAVETTKPKA